MSSVRKKLLTVFAVPTVLSLLLVVIYETELLLPGSAIVGGTGEFYLVGLMEIVTICSIPPALRLMKFGFVRRALAAAPSQGLTRWGSVRLLLIALPMLANTFLYYQYMNVAFGYMAIIGLLSLAFVYPSETRCRQEMDAAS